MPQLFDLKKVRQKNSLIIKRASQALGCMLKIRTNKPQQALKIENQPQQFSPKLKFTQAQKKNPELNAATSQAFDLKKKETVAEPNFYLPYFKQIRLFNLRGFRFAILLIGLILVLKLVGIFHWSQQNLNTINPATEQGLASLTQAVVDFQQGDFAAAQKNFTAAYKILTTETANLPKLKGPEIVFENQSTEFKNNASFLTASTLLAKAGLKFTTATQEIALLVKNFPLRQAKFTQAQPVNSLATEIHQHCLNAQKAALAAENALAILTASEIPDLPPKLQDKLQLLNTELGTWLKKNKPMITVLPNFAKLLGQDGPKQYLILFQNPATSRGSGGIIDSIGILKLEQGYLADFQIQNATALTKNSTLELTPPAEFGLALNAWEFQDLNWDPNFAGSAQAIRQFFAATELSKIDGVFALNFNLLKNLITLVPEIELPTLGKITATEFWPILSLLTEARKLGTVTPEQILAEFWTSFQAKLPEISLQELVQVLNLARENKDLQFWSKVPELANLAQGFGLAQGLKEVPGDYLALIQTALTNNKSDAFLQDELTQVTKIGLNGEIENTLTLQRKHAFTPQQQKYFQELASRFDLALTPELAEALGAGENLSLLKIFVPRGAELKEVTGIPFEAVKNFTSAGKQVFSFILAIAPEETRTVSFVYQLQPLSQNIYQFTTDFQSGKSQQILTKELRLAQETIFAEELKLGEALKINF